MYSHQFGWVQAHRNIFCVVLACAGGTPLVALSEIAVLMPEFC